MKPETSVHPPAGARFQRSALAAMLLTLLMAVVLPIAALIDQLCTRTLDDYSNTMYAAHGVSASSGEIYVLLYIAAGFSIASWLIALTSVGTRRKWARASVIVAIVVSALIAGTLFMATEYGQHIFPPIWGVFASLAPIAGIVSLAISTNNRE